jgi:hypothetical protein
MIRLTIQETEGSTYYCRACTVGFAPSDDDDDVCLQCEGYIVTHVECPYCEKIDHYMGWNGHEFCVACGTIFPDLQDLKHDVEYRIAYHLGLFT